MLKKVENKYFSIYSTLKEIIPFECIDIYNFILSIFVNQPPPPMILSKYSIATICLGVINFHSMF